MTPLFAALAMLAADPATAPTFATPAYPWSISISEEGVVRAWADDPNAAGRQDFEDGMNRLYALVSRGGLEFGLQVDAAFATPNSRSLLTTRATPPLQWSTMVLTSTHAGSGFADAAVIEKKFAHWSHGSLDVRAGDGYRSVGRGMVLALVKNAPLDIDTSIEGGQASTALGPVDLAAWGGRSNPQTIAALYPNRIARDPRDRILGGAATVHAGFADLGFFANHIDADPKAPSQLLLQGDFFGVQRTTALGASLSTSNLGGVADVYLEADGARIHGLGGTGAPTTLPGEGYYGTVTAYLGPWSLQLEGKRYYHLELLSFRESGVVPHLYDYSTPPTLEKEDVIDIHSSEAANSNDIGGGRLIAGRDLGRRFLAHLTYAHFEDHGQDFAGGVNDNARIQHAYASLERRSAGRFWQVTAGLRYETHLAHSDEHDVQPHADADVFFPVKDWTVEAKTIVYRQMEWIAGPLFDVKQTSNVSSSSVSARPSEKLTVALSLDSTDDPRSISGSGNRQGNLTKNLFGGVELVAQPTDASNVRLFAGATEGGLKCSGGVCGYVPAFSGVRLSWLARF